MKTMRLTILSAVLATLLVATAVHAASAKTYKGTVKSVGSSDFTISIKGKPDLDVACDGNTVFTQNGTPADPSALTEGATVTVTGAKIGDNKIHGQTVKIMSAGKSPTTKPSSNN